MFTKSDEEPNGIKLGIAKREGYSEFGYLQFNNVAILTLFGLNFMPFDEEPTLFTFNFYIQQVANQLGSIRVPGSYVSNSSSNACNNALPRRLTL